MAVPGPAGAASCRGCHRLIKQGAALVECANDVLEVLGIERCRPDPVFEPVRLDERTDRVLTAVGFVVTTTDAIVEATGFGIGEVLQNLSRLELGGFVTAVTGGYIRRPLSMR
jgi:DNA processing protein